MIHIVSNVSHASRLRPTLQQAEFGPCFLPTTLKELMPRASGPRERNIIASNPPPRNTYIRNI